ncbi:hypothetical protein MKK55_11435 [Methylobacterium sp. J-059]|uniref:hypothetical protein n=1 Tax=Methylobacterium sp. J-059 TaxID=2836643 RepID=UPI001FB9B7C7|nr:hypothetical protein [Methylobacterium sp. J-059]MCJ2039548.1 hypothetical protein [Methylobacterium sp. J-059]
MPAGAMIGGGAISAGAGLIGSSQAASAQKKAAQIASATQLQMYDQTRKDLAPYRDLGTYASGQLQNRLTDLTSPIVMDQAAVEQTPGYKFNLSQGLKAAQNSAAARGLGLSGAAIKGATNFATGLADSTFQNQFNNAVTNQSNAFNRLMSTTALGSSAAAQQASANQSTGQNLASTAIGAGSAQAAAAMSGANAVGTGVNTAAQSFALAPIYNKLLDQAGGSGGSSSSPYWSGWSFMPKNYGG